MIKKLVKTLVRVAAKPFQKQDVFVNRSLHFLNRQRKIDAKYLDYIRLASLELAAYEINHHNLKGNVAELGVYKGAFAKLINGYFPERSLYLFDTFEGFDKRDVAVEKKESFSTGAQDFSQTSVNEIIKIMPFPEKCLPKKGYFPESAYGVEDTFVFVSIDADLYTPILEGLRFFYPRLVKGGYIFVHDFNNDTYKGSRKAVEQFCSEQGIGFVPIPDSSGTAIITK